MDFDLLPDDIDNLIWRSSCAMIIVAFIFLPILTYTHLQNFSFLMPSRNLRSALLSSIAGKVNRLKGTCLALYHTTLITRTRRSALEKFNSLIRLIERRDYNSSY